MEIKNTFQETSKSDWLEKLAIDLPQIDIAKLGYKPDEKYGWSAFHHADDRKGKVDAPIFNYSDWLIGYTFDSSNIGTLLDSLNNGVNAPIFKCSLDEIRKIKGVNYDFIQSFFEVNNTVSEQEIENIEHDFDGSVLINYSTFMDSGVKSKTLKVKIEIPKTNDENKVETLKNVLSKVNNLFQKGIQSNQIFIDYELTKNHYLDIACLRALKLCIAKIQQENSLPIEDVFWNATITSENESDYHNSIYNTSKAISAICGGVHRIDIIPNPTIATDKIDSQKLFIEIQQLLQLESKWKSNDAMAGSYFIENLTDQIADLLIK